MKTLLIPSPAFQFKQFRSYHPMGLYSMQAVAAEAGYEVDVLNLDPLSIAQKRPATAEVGEMILSLFNPSDYDIVGFTTISGVLPIVLYVAEKLKAANPNLKIIFGGPHASFLHKETLDDFSFVDAIVVGEGELTFLEMLNSPSDWNNIEGVATRDNNFIPRPLIKDIDTLPYIDFANIPAMSGDTSFVRIEALRGCYGKCKFCSTTQYWQRRVRRKSPRRLIEEMERLEKATGYKRFLMVGDNFAKNRSSILELCRLIRDKGRGWQWCCAMSIAESSREELKEMHDAGCVSIFVGIESPNQNTLNRAAKQVDAKRTIEMIRAAFEVGIEVSGSQVIGFPWETDKDIFATVAHHKKLLEMGVFPCDVLPLVPIPGAEGFEDATLVSDIEKIKTNLPWYCQDEYTYNLIEEQPRQFTYFSYYETPHVSRQFVISAADSANQITGMVTLQSEF